MVQKTVLKSIGEMSPSVDVDVLKNHTLPRMNQMREKSSCMKREQRSRGRIIGERWPHEGDNNTKRMILSSDVMTHRRTAVMMHQSANEVFPL